MLITAIGGGNKEAAIRTTLDMLPQETTGVLIIPSACTREESYAKKVGAVREFFGKLGITSDVLHPLHTPPSRQELYDKLGTATLAYTIGGNTPYMMEFMRESGMAQPLAQAIRDGLAHAGTSAGALLPFELAHSNPAKRPAEEEWDFTFITALGIINRTVATAHANQYDPTPRGLRPDTRMSHMQAHMPEGYIGYAIDNGAALIMHGTGLQVVSVEKGSTAHLLQPGQTPVNLDIGINA